MYIMGKLTNKVYLLTTVDHLRQRYMTILVEPELGVAIPEDLPPLDLKARTAAASNTAAELAEHGLDVEPTKEDEDTAAKISLAYADNPDALSKKVSDKKVSTLTPASLVLTNNILTEFGRSVVQSSLHVRHLVTNKLLLETENPDPRVRIRALELLGKISDVGLFAEKSEVTITHQSTDDLRAKLRKKLQKLSVPMKVVQDAVVIDGEFMDIDAELGLDEQNQPSEASDDG
jgi:uncharacterized UBP type Zn finger protein|tara:strand:- start:347 stop:1042 length:696 start_codon:yes stop_codon:yes gene_type:complete